MPDIKNMKTEAIVFVNGRQTSTVTSVDDLIKEINTYRTFMLSNVMFRDSQNRICVHYINEKRNVQITIHGFSTALRHYLSNSMR